MQRILDDMPDRYQCYLNSISLWSIYQEKRMATPVDWATWRWQSARSWRTLTMSLGIAPYRLNCEMIHGTKTSSGFWKMQMLQGLPGRGVGMFVGWPSDTHLKMTNYTIRIWMENRKLVWHQRDVPAILKKFHDSPLGEHWSRDRMLANIQRSRYWPTMRRDVEGHAWKCDACQRWKPGPHPSGISVTFITKPFKLLLIDWLLKLPVATSGNSCMITCTDALTQWREMRSTTRVTALESARFFMK